jgi:hypothetical protein
LKTVGIEAESRKGKMPLEWKRIILRYAELQGNENMERETVKF